jgi:hypothetical protein
MGKKPDQIEQDIRSQRDHISRRIEDLQHRVQDDMASVRSEAKDRASSAVDDAKGKIEGAKESLHTDTLKSMVEDHTISTMAGALGVGVLLGVISEGFGSGNGSSSRSGGYRAASDAREYGYESRRSQNGGGNGLAGMIASVVGPAASAAQDELQQLVRESFGTLKEQVNKVGKEDPAVKNRDVGVE